jgi:8-oxo-dGTP pyrophosphatase MutT (NUDIX family)
MKSVKADKSNKSPNKSKKKTAAPRAQYGALPWREGEDGVEILLVTSRDTRRWVIPKGWPMKGRKPHIAAAIEARQEAGLRGKIEKSPLGAYKYEKRLKDSASVTCRVDVFPLLALKQKKSWPEKNQRAAHWFPASVAAEQVDEPELREIIRAFDAKLKD